MIALLSSFGSLVDRHPAAVHTLSWALVLFTVAFVACGLLIDRHRRASERRFHDKFVRPAETRIQRQGDRT